MGRLFARLTKSRVTRRFVLPAFSPKFTAAITVCRTQTKKMQTDIASTVLRVRIQFFRRCLRTRGANFISGGQHSFLEMSLHVGTRSGPRIVRYHHNGLAELFV